MDGAVTETSTTVATTVLNDEGGVAQVVEKSGNVQFDENGVQSVSTENTVVQNFNEDGKVENTVT